MIECETRLHFLSRRTVELQLPSDACLLPGNQHSISPSTSSPSNTCVRQHPQTHTYVYTNVYTLPPFLASRRLLEGMQMITDRCGCSPSSSFSPSLLAFFLNPPKLCCFFRIPEKKLPPHPVYSTSWLG